MSIIDRILNRPEFAEEPPVLLDIGASGEIHHKWRQIAPYSVCIAFDADTREMGYTVKESSGYRKLYVYNSIVVADQVSEAEFHLTKSPFCSSLLSPDLESLDAWAFSGLFAVEKRLTLRAATLGQVLDEIGINRVDWFKSDTQGTDLRLFKSLGEERVHRVLAAEFEPGIINAYKGEDKLWSLMAYMETQPFWMAGLAIHGSQRISQGVLTALFSPLDRRCLHVLLNRSPGWGETLYLNSFAAQAGCMSQRDFLLGWVFAIIEKQYGFALELAISGEQRFRDPVFGELKQHALAGIRGGYWKIPGFVLGKMVRQFLKLLGRGE